MKLISLHSNLKLKLLVEGSNEVTEKVRSNESNLVTLLLLKSYSPRLVRETTFSENKDFKFGHTKSSFGARKY